jgi:hypothetical protein
MTNHSWPQTIRLILFSALIGGAAGVLTTALTTDALSQYALELGELTAPMRVTQERPRALPKSYEDSLARLEERALGAVGRLYRSVPSSAEGISVFASDTPIVLLTSDGWGLSASGAVGDTAVWGAFSCQVDQIVPEPMSAFVFVHCPTTSVPVVDIGSGYHLSAGDQLFLASGVGDVVFTQARAVVWGEAVRSSDTPSRRIELSTQGSALAGAAAFNVFGELVGFVTPGGEGIVPFEYLAGAFRQVLEADGAIVYPRLGVTAVDLFRAVGVSTEVSRGLHAGATLWGARAVEKGSPASQAGLMVGDILLSIEGETINGNAALDDLVAKYAPGDEIRIEIDRAGARQEVAVILGARAF